MKSMKILGYCMITPFLAFSQNEETKLTVQVSQTIYMDLFSNHGSLINSTTLELGADFQKKNGDIYLYFTYGFNTSFLYRGHFLGGAFEYHFLKNQKKVRPYFGVSVITEVATNYKGGFLGEDSFLTNDSHIHTSAGNNISSFNSSGFYQSMPFLGSFSVGCDFRLMKDLHLNLSVGLALQKLKYKYLEWEDHEDYREILKGTPVKSMMFSYVNPRLGLSYAFSFKKKEKI
ncbi:hypothetical protein CW751_00460 [Brumimicrobium salinarum]|uniref:DUF3575 domain-containing protein n=2 Tax=Brumimicrobium salinarum TaxID=2058658 RepID=A0A2I0R5K8_9FLAO|nr:hypothetical protein CW751_00460 [Brumimicrobium salinarum]